MPKKPPDRTKVSLETLQEFSRHAWQSMTRKQRADRARKAAIARWAKARAEKKAEVIS